MSATFELNHIRQDLVFGIHEHKTSPVSSKNTTIQNQNYQSHPALIQRQ